jgi:PEGA domain-containing protein
MPDGRDTARRDASSPRASDADFDWPPSEDALAAQTFVRGADATPARSTSNHERSDERDASQPDRVLDEIRARILARDSETLFEEQSGRPAQPGSIIGPPRTGYRKPPKRGFVAAAEQGARTALTSIRARWTARSRSRQPPKPALPADAPPRRGPLHIALAAVVTIAVLEAAYIWSMTNRATSAAPSGAAVPSATEGAADLGAAPTPTSTIGAGPASTATTTDHGQLIVRSEPAGAHVLVDGKPYGKTPLVIRSVAAGEHRLVLKREGSELTQRVRVEPGTAVSVIVPMKTASANFGFVAVSSPLELDVLENGALIGTTRARRLALPPGPHTLELVNSRFGFRSTMRVSIDPGRETKLPISLPAGAVNVNATPWAEVWVDGELVGETPIGNLRLPIGEHEVLFRHPQLGEKTVMTAIKLDEVTRVTTDLRTK